jgi:hypothetical protein
VRRFLQRGQSQVSQGLPVVATQAVDASGFIVFPSSLNFGQWMGLALP